MARTIERGDLLNLSAEELGIAIATEKYKRNLKRKRQQMQHESHAPKISNRSRNIVDPYADAQFEAYQRFGCVDDYDYEGFSA